jgi:hypothetical protein
MQSFTRSTFYNGLWHTAALHIAILPAVKKKVIVTQQFQSRIHIGLRLWIQKKPE